MATTAELLDIFLSKFPSTPLREQSYAERSRSVFHLAYSLIKNYKKPEDLIGENGLLKQLTKRLLERAMQAELPEHLGYEKHAPSGNNTGNSRNGG